MSEIFLEKDRPPERRAMRQIVQAGDMYEVRGIHYLVAPVTPETLEASPLSEAAGEEREYDLCDEASCETWLDEDDEYDQANGLVPQQEPFPVVDADHEATGDVIKLR